MTDLSPEARRLLGLARRGDDPLENDRARLDRRMSQRLAVAAGVTGLTLGSAKVASGAAIATMIGKGVATGVVVTATAFGLWKAADQVKSWPSAIAGRSALHRAAAPSNAPSGDAPTRVATPNDASPIIAGSSTRTTTATDDAIHAATPNDASPIIVGSTTGTTTTPNDASPIIAGSATRQPKKDRSPTVHGDAQQGNPSVAEAHAVSAVPTQDGSTADPLQDEVAALRDAQQAISVGQSQRALVLVAEQNRKFAGGALQQERAAARVFALCNLGRQSEARGEASAFEQRWPRSPLIARVRRACDGEPPK